jgi:hypothetical protein
MYLVVGINIIKLIIGRHKIFLYFNLLIHSRKTSYSFRLSVVFPHTRMPAVFMIIKFNGVYRLHIRCNWKTGYYITVYSTVVTIPKFVRNFSLYITRCYLI